MKYILIVCVVVVLIGFQNFALFTDRGLVMPDFPRRNVDTRTLKRNSTTGLYETQTPHVPIHEVTLDGRIAIRKRGDPGGIPIEILKPEKVKNFLTHGANEKVGAGMIGAVPSFLFDLDQSSIRSRLPGLEDYRPGRTIICEKTMRRKNPYLCANGIDDCYDMTLVTRFDFESGDVVKFVMTSVDITLQVGNPKTTNAFVRVLTPKLNTIKQGPEFPYPKLAEPVIVGDNRLLIFRLGRAHDLKLSDGVTPAGTGIDIVYSAYRVADDSGNRTEQCDVTKWTPAKTHPISHAPYDVVNNMKNRYKFARYPFRDSLGQLIPNGQDLGGSYQWMDKDAANLFYTSFGTDSFYNVVNNVVTTPYQEPSANYFSPTAPGDIDSVEEVSAATAGIAMLGFWTHGKAILLDGQLNNADYNFRIADRTLFGPNITVERQLKLYSNPPLNQEFEPIGGVRELGGGDFDARMYHPLLALNSSFLGSFENRFHYLDTMFPVTPRDLVWQFSSTRHTEEIVFDEYVNPYVLINAEMTGAIGQLAGGSSTYYDGILRGIRRQQLMPTDVNRPANGQLYFQNAVSQPPGFFKAPLYGEPVGNLRMEPIAKGGIYGKGVWFNGLAGLRFSIPDQTGMSFNLNTHPEWFVSVFIDPRELDLTLKERILFSLGNGESVSLAKVDSSAASASAAFDTIVLRDRAGIKISELPLGNVKIFNQRWAHVAIQFKQGVLPVLYMNGYRYGKFSPLDGVTRSALEGFFRVMDLGALPVASVVLGAKNTSQASIRGWFDEFKVIARAPSSEEICNYARGTLVDATNSSDLGITRTAARYPLESHQLLKDAANLSGTNFACYVNYGGDAQTALHSNQVMAHHKNLPTGTTSIREKILMRRNGLVFGKPRPDFTSNRFCLSCHVTQSASSFPEMDIRALLPSPLSVNVEDDPRRQPSQPDAIFRGVIPANYFGPGQPASPIFSNEQKVDRWILDRN